MSEFKTQNIHKVEFNYNIELIQQISHTKRFLELWTIVPGIKQMNHKELEQIVKDYKLDISLEDIRILFDETYCQQQNSNNLEISEAAANYHKFVQDKIIHRAYLQTTGCVPSNKKFAKWRSRQVNRCWIELGKRNASMIHSPVIFELSDGCSVGCSFCGLNAGKLKGYYKGTPENLKFWREILHAVKKIVGDAAGTGTCYYASEPFDNLDYEVFSQEFYNILGLVPQVTTAVAMRDPERTRRFLNTVREHEFRIHRFSVLSLNAFHDIIRYFTPEELIYVELLPQFIDAPSNKFSVTGRQFIQNTDTKSMYNNETICCISGFVINMPRKQIRLVTPCITDAAHPTGEMILEERNFSDIDSFVLCLEDMINKNMDTELDTSAPLILKDGITYDSITSSYKKSYCDKVRTILGPVSKETNDLFNYIGLSLSDHPVSADYIAEDLLLNHSIAPEQSYYIINRLFHIGILENGNY